MNFKLLALALFILNSNPTDSLEFEERCDPTRVSYNSNPGGDYDYNRCDAKKGLYCNEYSRCACYVADSYYEYRYRRCIAKVGHPCRATYTFSVPCGENAECTYDTGFCQCRLGYYPTYDQRACTNHGNRLKSRLGLGVLPILVLTLSLGLISYSEII